jgi:predicted AlkP superfamily pyrophosphatase or phosphodiesterase
MNFQRALTPLLACILALPAFAQQEPGSAPETPAPPAAQQPAQPAPAPAGQQAPPASATPAPAQPPAAPAARPAAEAAKESPGEATAEPSKDGKEKRHARAAVELPPPPSAYNAHPKLVVFLVIDQFRADYLDRYRADFKNHGFKLFLEKGAYFPDCYYDYANTKTAPGHATLGTGAYTDGHGISSNEWWDLARSKDHTITSVEDERYHLVGLPAGAKSTPGASPLNLLASTLGDELRLATQGRSKVFGVSLKDRASILPSGHASNAAFWIDPQSGAFITSSYYLPQLPQWAADFNASGEASQDLQAASAETGATSGGFYNVVGHSSYANQYELDFAKALITGEQLGTRDTTDLVTLSLSANDIIGHTYGPDSEQEHEMVDSLDTDLDSFFTWLDKNIPGGLANVWITLSADHGVAPSPAQATSLGMPAATIDLKKVVASLNDAINLKFSPGEKVSYVLTHQELPYLSLNQPAFDRAGINELEAETAVQKAIPAAMQALTPPAKSAQPADAKLPPRPTLFRTFTRLELEAGTLPPTDFGRILAHSYSPNGGWYVMLIPAAYQMESYGPPTGTTHFSPWSYDRHVPLGFYGAVFAPGIYHGRVAPVDLASTLAAELGVNQPSAAVGTILTQALKPASAISYPKPAPVRTRTATRHHATASPESHKDQ